MTRGIPALTGVPGIGLHTAKTLAEHGFSEVAQLASATPEHLARVPGFQHARALKTIAAAQQLCAQNREVPGSQEEEPVVAKKPVSSKPKPKPKPKPSKLGVQIADLGLVEIKPKKKKSKDERKKVKKMKKKKAKSDKKADKKKAKKKDEKKAKSDKKSKKKAKKKKKK